MLKQTICVGLAGLTLAGWVGMPSAAVADIFVVKTSSDWDAAWTTPLPNGDKSRFVSVQSDLARTATEIQESGTGSDDDVAAFVIRILRTTFQPKAQYPDLHEVVVDCGGHKLEWNGDWSSVSGDSVAILGADPHKTRPADISVRNCVLVGNPSEAGDPGDEVVGFRTHKEPQLSNIRYELEGNIASQGIDRAFVIGDEAVQFYLENNRFGGAIAAIGDDYGDEGKGYHMMLRENFIEAIPSSTAGERLPGKCIGLEMPVYTDPEHPNQTDAYSMTSIGNHFHACDKISLEGVHMTSTGDTFDSLGHADRSWGDADPDCDPHSETDCEAMIEVGTLITASPSGASITSGTIAKPQLAHSTLFKAGQFEFIRADLRVPKLYDNENDECEQDEIDAGLFSAKGALLDAEPFESGGLSRIPGEVSIVLHTWRSNGRQCGPAKGDPEKFLTPEAKAMCRGVDSNGRCFGKIEIPGLGQWELASDQLHMQPGIFNVIGDDTMTGSTFCANPPGASVHGDLHCADVRNPTSGASIPSVCSATLAADTFYDVRCVTPPPAP